MQLLWLDAAAVIEFAGALMIAGYAVRAALALPAIDSARQVMATGAIAGLDFKLAATLLKTLTLLDWSQIAMFAAIYVIRLVLKQAFSFSHK